MSMFLIQEVVGEEFVDKRNYLLDPNIVTINKIKISDKEADIVKKLGKPVKIDIGFSEVMAVESKDYLYPGMKIYIIESSIYNLKCNGKDCVTDKNITIGNSPEDVLKAYGPGKEYSDKEGLKYISYPLKNLDAYLKFNFEHGKIIEIEYFVDYV